MNELIDGHITSSPFLTKWSVPYPIQLEGGFLKYEFAPKQSKEVNFASAWEKIFSQFINLWKETEDKRIHEFAQKYGVLGFCEHGLRGIYEKQLAARPLFTVSSCDYCKLDVLRSKEELRGLIVPEQVSESLYAWRFFSEQAHAILHTATAVKRGVVPAPQYFKTLTEWCRPINKQILLSFPNNLDGFKRLIELAIMSWLYPVEVRPSFVWSPERAHIRLEPQAGDKSGFFAALGIMLMFMVSGSTGIAHCANCPNTIFLNSKKKQRISGNHYCDSCRRLNIPGIRAVRKYRSQEKANPNREKRKSLTPQQITIIQTEWKKYQKNPNKELLTKLYERLSNELKVSTAAIRRRIDRITSPEDRLQLRKG